MSNLNEQNQTSCGVFSKEKLSKAKPYFLVLVPMILLCVYFIYIAMPSPMPRIGVVNITGIVNDFVVQESKVTTSPLDLRVKVKLFSSTLEKIMNDLSAEKRVVLMPSEAVIAGAEDYTKEVQTFLAKAIKNEDKAQPQGQQTRDFKDNQQVSAQGSLQPTSTTPTAEAKYLLPDQVKIDTEVATQAQATEQALSDAKVTQPEAIKEQPKQPSEVNPAISNVFLPSVAPTNINTPKATEVPSTNVEASKTLEIQDGTNK